MTSWLLVAIAADAELAILCGVFLAGSLQKWNMIWGACLVAMGVVVFGLLMGSSLDSLPSALNFSPARVAQGIVRESDIGVVIKGVLVGIPGPLLAYGIVIFVLRNSHRWQGPVSVAIFASVLLALFLVTAGTSTSAAVPLLNLETVTRPRQDVSSGLTVPAGFSVKDYLPYGINKITSITFDSKDRLFVASQDGVVVTVDDIDNDGVGDKVGFFMSKAGAILGIAISDDDKTLYVAGGGNVLSVVDMNGDGIAETSTVIIDGLPSFLYANHSNNGLVIGPDGRLYMTLGGTTSHGPENYPMAGSILVANADGSDLHVYARGFRNPYDLTFTSTGLLVVSDNGPEFNVANPDELNIVEEGGHYGYPDYFGNPPPGSGTIAPVVLFPDHSVPTGKIAYPGGQFPAEFQDKIFLALFMGDPLDQSDNSKVVVITLEEGKAGAFNAVVRDFATGFSHAIDVAVDSRGRLYIADYSRGQVYQVSWLGGG